MPYRLLLPLMLIFLLGADGVLGAWASTRMALHAMSDGDPLAVGDIATQEVCDPSAREGAPATSPATVAHGDHPGGKQGGDRGCADSASCDCICMLTFYPPSATTLFASRHSPISMDTLFPPLDVPPSKLSRVFRPPIA